MYQIFVVEDELLIRQSIRNAIEKMPGPYACCGEASDGEMALAMMQDLMPDILLTDIRMPFLDGFGLIQNAKAMMPWLKIVIISGFGDFESAQKAISLGVDQYLLKPVRQADLMRVIEEMAAQIEKSKADRGTALPEGLDEEEVLKVLRQHFMRQLIYGEADTGKLLERMQQLKLDIMRTHYLVAVFSFDSPDIDHKILENTVLKALNETGMLMYYFNNRDRMTLVAYDNDPDVLNERIYQFNNILRHELQDVCPVITTIISDDVGRLGEISDAYKTAYGMLKTITGTEAGQVLNVSDTARISADMNRQENPGEMKNHQVISRAEAYLKENFCDPNISLLSVANHVCMSAAYFSTVFSQTTGRPFIAYLTALRIEKAKELLTATGMKLSDIALEIGYNEPNYFSHVFRKTTGMTPKEYRNQNQRL